MSGLLCFRPDIIKYLFLFHEWHEWIKGIGTLSPSRFFWWRMTSWEREEREQIESHYGTRRCHITRAHVCVCGPLPDRIFFFLSFSTFLFSGIKTCFENEQQNKKKTYVASGQVAAFVLPSRQFHRALLREPLLHENNDESLLADRKGILNKPT